jgi:hypothetical protein
MEAPYSANFFMFDPDGLKMQFTVRWDIEEGVVAEHIETHIKAVQSYADKLKQIGFRVNVGSEWARPEPPKSVLPEVDFGSNPGGTAKVTAVAERKMGQVDQTQLNVINALGMALYESQELWDTKRHALVSHFTDKRTQSSKDLWVAEAVKLQAALEGKLREEYAKVAEGYPNPFELANIDDLTGVKLAKALTTLRALVRGSGETVGK